MFPILIVPIVLAAAMAIFYVGKTKTAAEKIVSVPPNPRLESLYGHIEWAPDTASKDPQAIKITNGWAEENIVPVDTVYGTVQFHKRGAAQLREFLTALKGGGFPVKVVQTWNPRRIRPKGNEATGLSWHAYGAAVDINPGELPLGSTVPADHWIRGAADVGANYGFSWGGNFGTRPDPMHFQLSAPR